MKDSMRTIGAVALVGLVAVGVSVFAVARVISPPQAAPEETIGGTISATRIITQNARLTADVTCTVEAAPCIQFGAPNIKLNLNGFTMTGLGDPSTGCQGNMAPPAPVALLPEVGILASGQTDESILGPGLVQRFRASGILLNNNSSRILVTQVTASTNCNSGIHVVNSSDNRFEANVSVRNGTTMLPCGGLWITGAASRRNRVLRNQFSGNGYFRPGDPNFGIGLLAGGDNLIEANTVTGNVTGIRIQPASVGNIIRGNIVAGNPPILVSNNVADNAPFGFDILNLSDSAANTFENNLCLTSMNAPCLNLRPSTDVVPISTGVVFNPTRVGRGSSFSATFAGSNLTSTTYFDIRFRAPGASSDEFAGNWQQGGPGTHTIPPNTAVGDWTITGLRAHQDASDHSGPFEPVQTTLSVF